MEDIGEELDQVDRPDEKPDKPEEKFLTIPWQQYTAAHLAEYPQDWEIIRRINNTYDLETFAFWEYTIEKKPAPRSGTPRRRPKQP